jgi:hypothetical protein
VLVAAAPQRCPAGQQTVPQVCAVGQHDPEMQLAWAQQTPPQLMVPPLQVCFFL